MTPITPTIGRDSRVLSSKPFRPRKGHRKSRNGCDACKRRKKKCDESASGCSGCLDRKIICHYSGPATPSRGGQLKPLPSPSAFVTSNGLHGLNSEETELFHHFNTQTLATLGSLSVQEVIASSLAAALDLDFLKHAACALSASHMICLSDRQDLACKYHLDRALFIFRQRLSSPITATQVDAVLTSCVLLNMIAFSNGHHRPENSWLFTSTSDLQWLTVQAGLRTIMSDVRHVLKDSSWATVYTKDAHEFRGTFRASFDEDILGLEDVPPDLKKVFGIEQHSNPKTNAYYTTLHTLVPLLTKNRTEKSLTRLMTVVHRFTPGLYQLLRMRDERALLLLAYWLGLMSEVHLWWISYRAQSECFACCRYLDVHGDDSIRALLAFPANQCGYQIGKEEEKLESVWASQPAYGK
ncbi:MAG: hypothetical protein Q9177_001528 [Variospora cf. flavescens]